MNFLRTIGHEKQKQMFEQAAKSARLSHAYILAGPAHVGKTTFALDLAAVLGAHPVLDVALHDLPAAITVEEARAVQSRLALTPAGKWKVAIIVGAENMNAAAANSLLKTLEEPPRQSILLLVAGNYYGLLPTVASRLQRINFSPLSDAEVAAAVAPTGLVREKAERIVSLAAGRIGLAKSLAADEALYDFYLRAAELCETLESGDTRSRLAAAAETAALETPQIETFLEMAMRRRVQRETSAVPARKFLEAWQDLRDNINSKLLLDNLFLL